LVFPFERGVVVFVYEYFLGCAAFSVSFSFWVIQVSDVCVWDSFWYSRVIAKLTVPFLFMHKTA
jgi:hypothetical protein